MEITYSQGDLSAVWHIAPPAPGANIRMAHACAEDLALLQMRGPRLEGCFSAQEQSGTPLYGVMFVKEGHQSIRMKRSGVELAAGDIAIWRSDISCDFESRSGIEKLQLLVPAEVMHKKWPALVPDAACLRVKTDTAMPTLACGFLETIWRQRDYLSAAELRAAIHASMDLLVQGQTMVSSHSASSADRLSPIIRFVDESLEDAALSPSMIACRFGYSLRTMHAMFAKQGKTVSGEIRNRRLERCKLALAQSRSDLSISDLANRWGFSDASHFSKLFKLKYGVGPRAYRNACIASVPCTQDGA